MLYYHFNVGWYYFYLGLVMGSYISRLPDIKDNNNLNNTFLGIILVFGAIGAISSMPFILYLNKIIGSKNTLLFGSIWLAIILPFVGINKFKLALLIPSFYLVGCGLAIIDISMTIQVVIIEKKYLRNQMGIYSGTMAIGNFVGVIVGGLFASFHISTFYHFALLSITSLPFSFLSYYFLYNKSDENYYIPDHDNQTHNNNISHSNLTTPINNNNNNNWIN